MKNYSTTLISLFESIKNIYPIDTIPIGDLLELIRNGHWEKEISACRINENKKRELPCFTPSGIFNERNSKGIITYSGIICLDIDHLKQPEELKLQCKHIPWVWVAFITPGGKGLKILIQSNSPVEKFKEVESEIALSFYEKTGYKRDERAKDLARVQYVSFDPGLYLNSHPDIFEKRSH